MVKKIVLSLVIVSLSVSICQMQAGAAARKKMAAKKVKQAAKQKAKEKAVQNVNEKALKEAEKKVEKLSEDVNVLKAQIDKIGAESDELKLSGEIFFQYQKPMQNFSAATYNGFDVTRAYINFKKNLDARASMRITLDVSRIDPAIDAGSKSQQLFDFLKFAYVDLPVDIPSNIKIIPFSMTARLGLQPTVWVDWVQKIWAHRYIAKVLVDNEGLLSTADFGFGAGGKFTLPYLPEFEYQSTVLNGAGFKKAENNNAKDISLRLNAELYKNDNIGNIIMGAHINMKDQIAPASSDTKQAGILLAFSNTTYGTAYGEYLRGTKVSGYSCGGYAYPVPALMLQASLIGRLDNYDPDTTVTNDEINRAIIGAAYDFGKNVQISFNIQDNTVGSGAASRMGYLQSIVAY